MLTLTKLQSLAGLPGPILTVILDTSRKQASRQRFVPVHVAWLKKEIKALSPLVPRAEQALFKQECERVLQFLRVRVPQEKSLVILAGPKTWEVIPMQQKVTNDLHWGRPAMSQLFWPHFEEKAVCVVAVDRSGARFFRHEFGEMSELDKIEFDVNTSQWKRGDLGHVSRPGIQTTHGIQRDVFDHRMDAQFAHMLRVSGERARFLCENQNLTAVFLVGSDRLTEPIANEFPPEWRNRVQLIEEDYGNLAANELQKRIEPEIETWKTENDSALVSSVLNADRGAVLEFDEVLAQLQNGRIRSLVIERDLNADLHECTNCNSVDRSADPCCPVCGCDRHNVTLREILPGLILRLGVHVEVVSGAAADALKARGGMAAWLRHETAPDLQRAAGSFLN
jgi:hypothetical protein